MASRSLSSNSSSTSSSDSSSDADLQRGQLSLSSAHVPPELQPLPNDSSRAVAVTPDDACELQPATALDVGNVSAEEGEQSGLEAHAQDEFDMEDEFNVGDELGFGSATSPAGGSGLSPKGIESKSGDASGLDAPHLPQLWSGGASAVDTSMEQPAGLYSRSEAEANNSQLNHTEASISQHNTTAACSTLTMGPQDAAKVLWLDPAEFRPLLRFLGSGRSVASSGMTGTREETPLVEVSLQNRVSEDALDRHIWEMYCEREDLLAMVQEEMILGYLQTRSELHTWRRKVRHLKQPLQADPSGPSAIVAPLVLAKATEAAASLAAKLASRKEQLQSLSREFQMLSSVVDERPNHRAESQSKQHRRPSGAEQLELASAALRRKCQATGTMLQHFAHSTCALRSAIQEKEQLIQAAQGRLNTLRRHTEDLSDVSTKPSAVLLLFNDPVSFPTGNMLQPLWVTSQTSQGLTDIPPIAEGLVGDGKASKLLELREEVQALRARLGNVTKPVTSSYSHSHGHSPQQSPPVVTQPRYEV